MVLNEVMYELEALGNERTKKIYIGNGAREPLFGVTIGSMKPLFRKIKKDHALAEQLYSTGNYDAMYFAGMIADPSAMREADFNRWIEAAYFFMISDYIVAVTLAEADCAQNVADKWIDSEKELVMSAGWTCYGWLLGWRPDDMFDNEKLKAMLDRTAQTVHAQPDRTKYSMNNFVSAVGISYLPLHEDAVKTAEAIGEIKINAAKGACALPSALETILKARDKGKLGFKRKNVRC